MTIQILQPPAKLAKEFLNFAKEIHQKSIDLGTKFTEEEIAEFFNASFSGKIRANFLLWIGDLNRIIEAINIILQDLSLLRDNKYSLNGDPVIRSEFLFQAFFGEFFRMREISKIFISLVSKMDVISNKNKEMLYDSYFTAFDRVYQIRNMMIHQGSSFKNYDVELPLDFLKGITKEEKARFVKLLENSNTREGTVEIQCAFYSTFIIEIMSQYREFQTKMGDLLADLILLYEEHAISITVTKNNDK